MKTLVKRCLLVSLLYAGTLYSQTAVVDENVRAAVHQSGRAMVLVKLRARAVSKSAQAVPEQQITALQNAVLAVLSDQDFQLRYKYRTVAGFSGLLSDGGLLKLGKHPEVESIQLDMSGRGGLAESVPAIQADVAHDLGFTGKNVVVGVLDTGVNLNHPDLSRDIVHQYHFLNQGADVGTGAMDLHGHGSNVAGIVTSDGTIAPVGVAPDARIVAIQVLDRNNRGWVSDWIAGLDYLVSNQATLNVQVVNMSLVTDAQFNGSVCDAQLSVFADVVARARNLGMVIFASSGNTGSFSSMTGPACVSGVVAVGAAYDSQLGREPDSGTYQTLFGGFWPTCFDATTSTSTLACFTSRTEGLDLVAPGAITTSVGLGNGTSTFRGTSQASPHAAGVAALMLEKNPNLTAGDIITALKSSSRTVNDPVTGRDYPLLNAIEALNAVTAIAEPGTPIPKAFSLEQNFPNPARNSGPAGGQTVIRYSLRSAASVTLTVYDLLGREVRKLVRGPRSAGRHRVTLDGAALANGIYLYKLQVGPANIVRKMIVLR